MAKNKLKQKLSFPQIITKFAQFIYLSISNGTDNILWESASSCSFGFIFSFIPVVLIIFTILASILKVSPGMHQYILEFCNQIKNIYDFTPLLENLLKINKINFIDIFLGIWVVWMARKLFLSVVQGMYRIFRSASKRKNAFNQVLTFISEFVIVITFIVVVLFTFLFDKMLQLPMFNFITNAFPHLFNMNSNILVSGVTYLLFFIFTLYCYKFVSGTNPKWRICIFYSLCSTAVTFVISFFLNKFMNLSNYNTIYGTISTVIILLFKVYLFFVVFLFCAQMIYVSQYFENLIIAQIYIIKDLNRSDFEKKVCSYLFKNPSLHHTQTHILIVPEEQTIFGVGDKADKIYYIRKGTVIENKGDIIITHNEGEIFGEIPCILDKDRDTTAFAKTDCEFMVIEADKFLEIVKQNPFVSAKALSKINIFSK